VAPGLHHRNRSGRSLPPQRRGRDRRRRALRDGPRRIEREGSWRANKAGGGIVIDTISNDIIARGLSMPHSPRWHEGKLWVLESGQGRLCTIDPSNGAKSIVAEVPGFARGLAFAGPFAFIGLSQVRERVFDGIPIAARPERNCGVWLVDVRNGKTIGFIRFEGSV